MTKQLKKDRILKWDILQLAENATADDKPDDYQFFQDNFTGNCTDLFYEKDGTQKPPKKRNWRATIQVTAQTDDGIEVQTEFDFIPDRRMRLSEFMDGITPYWLDQCDQELAGMTCTKATAIATCRG